MKSSILALLASLTLTCSAHAYTVSFTNVLTPATPGALDTCVGHSSCDLGFGELTLDNSTILPAGFSMAGVALAPPNGVAYVGVGAGLSYNTGGYADITMFGKKVTGFSYDIGSVDSNLFDGTVNSIVIYTNFGYVPIDGADMLREFNGYREGSVSYSGPGYIELVHLFANHNAMDIGNFSATVATPETSTWVMMLMGFAGLGYVASKRTRLAAVGT